MKKPLLVVTSLAMASCALATVHFTESFESPPHTLGSLPSNSWVNAVGVISKDVARSGSNSLKGTSHPSLQRLATGARLISAPTGPVVNFSTYALATQGGTALSGLQYGIGTGALTVSFGFATSINQWILEVQEIGGNTLVNTSGVLGAITPNAWNEILISHDTAANQINFSVNGLVKTSLSNFSSLTTNGAVAVLLRGNTFGNPSTSEIYFDDLQVESVPEPAVLGLAALLLLRKKRQPGA